VLLSTTKYRIIAISTAVVLGLCSLALTVAITGAILGLPGFASGPGAFLAACYGLLALGVPAFLFYAALILVDKEWRPDRIFILAVSLFPFMTLATGVVFVRDYESRADRYFFLAWAGRTGFSFTIVVLTVLEVLTIMILKVLLFPRPGSPEKKVPGTIPDEVPGTAGIVLPALKPLASARAFKKLEPRLAGEPEEQAPPQADAEGAARAPDTIPAEPETDAPEIEAPGAIPDTRPAEPETEVSDTITGPGTLVEVVSVKPRPVPKTKIRGSWKVPVDILNHYPDGEYWIIDEATRAAAVTLRATLEEFHIQAEVTGIRKGPVITMFEILPAPGVKLSKIVNLQDNIALRLAASSVRIVAPIPGKHAVGIEVPNAKRNIVSFREIIEGELHREGKKEAQIPVVLGKDITGEAQTTDLAQMPHLLIAGATGSGKSVCVNSMILSILYQKAPAECRLILIDPKIVELKLYNDIPHLLTPVITEPKRAFQALQYLICEMERRYACLDSMGVRDIKSYNRRIKERSIAAEHLPYIVVVIDEFADLMATTGKELESTVARLAAMSRAVGIHLVLATQRPSIDVITGLIKANIPSRIAFMVASKMDSRIIIDQVGAEKLLGKGDMLYAGAVDPFPIRMQGAFISEEEVETVVEHIKTLGTPDYIDDEIFYDDDDEADPSLFGDGDDPMYEKALEIVLQQGKASASYIQRRLKIGYNRAARLVELMEQNGVVGPAQGSRPRELLRAFN
jgi:S-DNA-T family DNA segregation ATPase FtsK/SpoIIIE